MTGNLLKGLNPSQKNAVFTESGPLLVLAGAGTGKTRVVTVRIAHLIKKGVRPDRILAVTFTNRAANEMKSRVSQLLGRKRKLAPEISTFHSLCVRILRRNIERLGYRPTFMVYARGQQESLARQVLRSVSVPAAALSPVEMLQRVGMWKNHGLGPEAALSHAESDKEHLAAMAFRRYQQELQSRSAVDFDDLLLCAERLFAEFDDVRKTEAQRFDHIMVDEYQDTNGSQYRIVRALADPHQNLCVVGDDDQSIYGWRGAEVEHILRFANDWPAATVVRLEDNYRSSQAILELSNRLIGHNKTRHDKLLRAARPNGERPRIMQFRDEVEEAKEIVSDIRHRLERHEFEPRDYAILFRTNEQPRAFESELRRCNLPYVLVGGMSFFDRREVRDAMAYMRLLDDPDEETSLLRVLNTPPRGIGKKTIDWLTSNAVQRGATLWNLISDGALRSQAGNAAGALGAFAGTVHEYRARLGKQPAIQVIRDLLEHVGYQKELERLYPDPVHRDSRWAAIEEVVNELGAYEQRRGKKASLGEFLDEVAVNGMDDVDDKDQQLRRNAIALMTLHAAKGLEFRSVYMVGMEEGLLPHRRSIEADGMAIEEERRLCYVGITRAEDRLTMSLALSRRKWGKAVQQDPSRFLFEIMGTADSPPKRKRTAGRRHTHKKKKTAKRSSQT